MKYDAVANDVPRHFTVQGYPTIYLLTNQDKTSPILFNAPRKHSTLLKFVAEKATNQLKSFNREGFSQVRHQAGATYNTKINHLRLTWEETGLPATRTSRKGLKSTKLGDSRDSGERQES